MTRSKLWASAFARQARSDLSAFRATYGDGRFAICHSLQFLQMACEKVAKAYLCASGSDPDSVQGSHAYIRKVVPAIARDQLGVHPKPQGRFQRPVQRINRLAGEVELLSPSVDDERRRPDNCEYPWEDRAGKIHVPAEWSFESGFPSFYRSKHPDEGLNALLKLLETAIHELA